MNQRTKLFLVAGLLLLALLLWLFLWSPSVVDGGKVSPASAQTLSETAKGPEIESSVNKPMPAPSTAEEQLQRKREAVNQVKAVFSAPIAFYGKVVDQHGEPVKGALADYSAIDRFFESGSKYKSVSNDQGLFFIEKIKGAGLLVSVSKEGYYPIDGKSSASFAYGVGPDSYRKAPPTKNEPAVFVLHKMGETEPLIRIETGGITVPKNGSPVRVGLGTGSKSTSDQAAIQVEAWTNNQGLEPNVKQPYDWHLRVTVPGGGLVERKDQFEFLAPEDGYMSHVEFGYRKDDQPWKSRFERNYFAKLSNGTYARFKLFFTSAGDHYFTLESYLNPTSGNRNLEYDPSKVVSSTP